PTIDGTPVGVVQNGTNTLNMTLPAFTTTQTNDIIVVCASAQLGPNVTSITSSSSLSFTRRAFYAAHGMEIWWALATNVLASEVITVHYSGNSSVAIAMVFAAHGCNLGQPWDTNSSIPEYQIGAPGVTWTGVSTTNNNNLLLQ